ncbi:MAG: PVC-type heme-binding CxxCH protein [Planctomycetaceae bacterium]
MSRVLSRLFDRCCVAFFVGLCCCYSNYAAAQGQSVRSPVDVLDTIANFEVHPDFKIELVASEPNIVDPVAIRFDEYDNMWVVEMGDYPHGPKNGEKPKSRIKILRDEDGDDFYETAHLFADNLLFATGLQPYNAPNRGTSKAPHYGVIVTLAGKVQWMSDTDGDFKADVVEPWFEGFEEDNPQLRANDPTMGPDGWIYVANGLRNGTVKAVKEEWNDQPAVTLRSQDFRFHPKTGKFEAISGYGQFGMTFDDIGNRFVCSNRNPCNHVVMPQRYLNRNPFLVRTESVEVVSPAAGDSKVFAISKPWTTSTLHAGQFTAACGVTIYRGDAFPSPFYGNSFVCEPTGNLVHRDVLIPTGPTFKSKYGREGVEFLASRDNWFRPVNLANAPDGCLYIVDMYRAVIEHPQFMPAELKVRKDLRSGDDRGRIYRVVPKEYERRLNSRFVKNGDAPSNGWIEDTFARIQETISVDRGQANSASRSQVLAIAQAKADFQRLLDADSVQATRLVLERAEPNAWEQQALLTHDAESSVAILKVLLRERPECELVGDLCQQIAMRDVDEDTVEALGHLLSKSSVPARSLQGLATGLRKKRKNLQSIVSMLPESKQAKLDELFANAAASLSNGDATARSAAIRMLAFGDRQVAHAPLLKAAIADSSAIVRVAAIEAVGRFQDDDIAKTLLESFNEETPRVQRAIVSSCVRNAASARVLVDAVIAKQVPSSSLDAASQRVLKRYKQAELKQAVATALASLVPADRQKVLAEYSDCIQLDAKASRGRMVFEKNCATCHRVGSIGVDIAPDIADSRSKTPEYLLMHILDPNRAVDANYFSYSALTNDGQVVTGIVASETAASITLKQAEGKVSTLLRADIDELKNNGISLMPVGLEKAINKQQMADLISFIKNWRYLDGEIPIELR